jgi:hypothetical protein
VAANPLTAASDAGGALARILQSLNRESHMTWKDKLELGLKPDAPFRKDNLPEQQVRGPEVPAGSGRSPVVPAAVEDVVSQPPPVATPPATDEPDDANDKNDTDDKEEVVP